ncbi:hypothetical protein Tco_0467955 [Tanacetum coccineum]
MNPIATQQVALDNALVAPEKRLKIEKCNARIEFNKPQREETYQTYLDFAIGKTTPKKARKFKKVASPSKKLSLVLEEEPVEKPKRAKKPAKKSTTVPTVGMDLLSEVALLEAAQLKKTLKKSKLETHKLHASGSGDGVGSKPKVPDESKYKTTGNSEDDDSNDDDNDDVSNDDDDDDDDDNDAGGDNEASDSEKTDFNEDENPNLNQKDDEEECVCTPDSYEFTNDDEEYEELYKDVNVRLKDAEHKEEGTGDAEMTDAGYDDGTQQTKYEQV